MFLIRILISGDQMTVLKGLYGFQEVAITSDGKRVCRSAVELNVQYVKQHCIQSRCTIITASIVIIKLKMSEQCWSIFHTNQHIQSH